jgi:hypothetical protein
VISTRVEQKSTPVGHSALGVHRGNPCPDDLADYLLIMYFIPVTVPRSRCSRVLPRPRALHPAQSNALLLHVPPRLWPFAGSWFGSFTYFKLEHPDNDHQSPSTGCSLAGTRQMRARGGMLETLNEDLTMFSYRLDASNRPAIHLSFCNGSVSQAVSLLAFGRELDVRWMHRTCQTHHPASGPTPPPSQLSHSTDVTYCDRPHTQQP